MRRLLIGARLWAPRVGLAVATISALLAWLEVARLAVLKRFSIDEFQYAHAAWLVAHGKVPHRDFFEFHFPLPYLSYSFFISDSPGSIAHLRLFMLALFALTSFGLYRINRRLGPALALVGPILAATSAPFVFFATEIRPDAMAFGLFIVSLSLFVPAPVGRARAAAAGVLWFLALFSTQKALIYSAPLAVLLVVNALRFRARRRLLASSLYLALGGAAVLLLVAVYFWLTRSGAAWFQQTVLWAVFHERRYPGFSWTAYGLSALQSAPALFVLGLLGALQTLLALKRSAARLTDPDLALLLVLASTLFSFGFARAPFPYALLPGLGMLCAFAPRGLAAIFSLLARLPKALRLPAGAALALLLAWLGPWSGVADAEQKLVPSNAYQYRVLADLERVTSASDPVYDNSGSYVSRPHVGFRYYTSALDRQVEAAELPVSVPRAIHEAGCTALLFDARFRGLPPPLIRYLTQHFQPYGADIWLWGERFTPSASPAIFDAVRDADYFVEPETVVTSGGLRIDGKPMGSAIFHLSRGSHRVEPSRSAPQFWILWLPADKHRYSPKYGLHPQFSSVF